MFGGRRVATTKRTQRGTGYPSWGHPTPLRISRGSAGLEDRRNVGENSCNSGDGTDQTGPILDVYDDILRYYIQFQMEYPLKHLYIISFNVVRIIQSVI
jgi:hypothetical protein